MVCWILLYGSVAIWALFVEVSPTSLDQLTQARCLRDVGGGGIHFESLAKSWAQAVADVSHFELMGLSNHLKLGLKPHL